jgi:superkiller protein 3
MSPALLKGKLKAARDALNKKDYHWHLAHDTSLQILEYEPENYNAYVYYWCAAIPRFDSLQ